jgi:dihydrofolate reductase
MLYTTNFITLDGVMSDPEVWHPAYASDESMDILERQMDAADAMLIGRRTYDEFAEYWPQQEDTVRFATRTNTIRKVVVTSRPGPLTWTNSAALEGDVPDGVRALKQQLDEVAVVGSATLTRSLLTEGLVDEMRFYLDPFVRGEGRRLFEAGIPATRLELVDQRALPRGVHYLAYRAST